MQVLLTTATARQQADLEHECADRAAPQKPISESMHGYYLAPTRTLKNRWRAREVSRAASAVLNAVVRGLRKLEVSAE